MAEVELTLDELIKQQEELNKQVAEKRKAGRKDALKKIREDIKSYVITSAELKEVLAENDKKTTKKERTVYAPEVKAKALAMNKEGKSNSDIAKELGFKTTVVAGWITASKKPKAEKKPAAVKKGTKK